MEETIKNMKFSSKRFSVPIIDEFTRNLSLERNLSAHTLRNYLSDISQFHEYLLGVFKKDALSSEDLRKVDHIIIRGFLSSMSEKGLSKTSVARKISAIRTFFNYICREGNLVNNPGKMVSTPKRGKTLPRFLSVDEANRLMGSPAGSDIMSSRVRAILETFYSAGLRIGEIVAINLEDLNLSDGLIKVKGKGRKERIVPVGNKAIAAIKEYLATSCHPELVSGSQTMRSRNKFGMTGRDNMETGFSSEKGYPLFLNKY